MNKVIIAAAVAGAGLATYLLAKRRSMRTEPQPALNHGRTQKHLTNVFARAKKSHNE